MARNKIQFQEGFSLQSFLHKYGSEEQCHKALFNARWSTGVVNAAAANVTVGHLEKHPLLLFLPGTSMESGLKNNK